MVKAMNESKDLYETNEMLNNHLFGVSILGMVGVGKKQIRLDIQLQLALPHLYETNETNEMLNIHLFGISILGMCGVGKKQIRWDIQLQPYPDLVFDSLGKSRRTITCFLSNNPYHSEAGLPSLVAEENKRFLIAQIANRIDVQSVEKNCEGICYISEKEIVRFIWVSLWILFNCQEINVKITTLYFSRFVNGKSCYKYFARRKGFKDISWAHLGFKDISWAHFMIGAPTMPTRTRLRK